MRLLTLTKIVDTLRFGTGEIRVLSNSPYSIGDSDDLRRRGMVFIVLCSWAVLAMTGVLTLVNGAFVFSIASFGVVLCGVQTWVVIGGRSDGFARLIAGCVLVVQMLCLLFALQGSPLQTDLSLYLILTLAALMLMWDTRPIIAASALIIAHHAVMIALAPERIFEGDGGYELLGIHALAIATSGSLFVWITRRFDALICNIDEARRVSTDQAVELSSAKQSLETTLADLKSEQEASAEARREVMNVQRTQYQKVAKEFEGSVASITQAVAQTARMLEKSAKSLRIIASETGAEAQSVASTARNASKAADTVAAGVAEISLSIAEIATNVSQQNELTTRATDRCGGGGSAIGSLSQQSQTIGETTRAIVRIAERTNLLSLNAAIEAASAGPSGRGFTIVAQEVKALANQASEAAIEIEDFLKGVKSGTVEAERSFAAINAVIGELNKAATAIRYDVDNQRQSADTIEEFARRAAGEADTMAQRTHSLSQKTSAAIALSGELEKASTALSDTVRNLENSTDSFMASLRAASQASGEA